MVSEDMDTKRKKGRKGVLTRRTMKGREKAGRARKKLFFVYSDICNNKVILYL